MGWLIFLLILIIVLFITYPVFMGLLVLGILLLASVVVGILYLNICNQANKELKKKIKNLTPKNIEGIKFRNNYSDRNKCFNNVIIINSYVIDLLKNKKLLKILESYIYDKDCADINIIDLELIFIPYNIDNSKSYHKYFKFYKQPFTYVMNLNHSYIEKLL